MTSINAASSHFLSSSSNRILSASRSLAIGIDDNDPNAPFILFPLERSIRVSVFPAPVPSPLDSYRPSYSTLPDGSLLTSVYVDDLSSANSRLFGLSSLLMLGAINVWTCVAYIRRGKIKDKTLFYLLLGSQLLIPACFSALLAPFFLLKVNCTIINIVAVLTTLVSYAILITGILGLKAYRCLNRPRIILFVVVALQLAIFALFALDIPTIHSKRRISGSCSTDGNLRFMPIGLMLICIEALFLALCFLYAVWKSSLHPAAQGRISLTLSEKAPADEPEDAARRGWWDYVPQAPPSYHGSDQDDSLVRKLRNSVWRFTTTDGVGPSQQPRKSSIPTDRPLSQPPRPSATSGKPGPDRTSDTHSSSRTISMRPSMASQRPSQIGPFQELALGTDDKAMRPVPRILQVRAVIKDELIYSTVIMASCFLSAVLGFIRAKEHDVVFGPSVWLGANWAFISLLVMLTFSRVVRRHEREAILQSPSALGPMARNEFFGGPSAIARRRRDAVALAGHGDIGSSNGGSRPGTRRRRLLKRSSWDYETNIYSPSVFEDNASMRRKEGLREWDREKEARIAAGQNENPFADFDESVQTHVAVPSFKARYEDEDILRMEYEKLESIRRMEDDLQLQRADISSPWNDMESPDTYVGGDDLRKLGQQTAWDSGGAKEREAGMRLPSAVAFQQGRRSEERTQQRRGALTSLDGIILDSKSRLRAPSPGSRSSLSSLAESRRDSGMELLPHPRT